MGREEVRIKAEIEHALRQVSSSTIQIRSKRQLRSHIIEVARQYGFDVFKNTRFGYEDFTVKTRVKFYRKYGKPPTMKILVIPNCLVRRLCSTYKKWPELGEFLLRTSLWHEYQHLLQDPTTFGDFTTMEEEANRLMMEKMGRPGLVVCVWYFCLYGRAGIWDRILNRKKRLDQGEAGKEIVNCLEKTYPNLVSSNEYDEIIDDVLWLETQYQNHVRR